MSISDLCYDYVGNFTGKQSVCQPRIMNLVPKKLTTYGEISSDLYRASQCDIKKS